MTHKNILGVVIIGRNEGQRLADALNSVIKFSDHIVYVDSGSTDNSLKIASDLGVNIVNLDMTVPFTAARARNEGFNYLCTHCPDVELVQFFDGDCVVINTWFDSAINFLYEHPNVGIVCGRRRERYPEQSVYNLLCDIEWDTPIGITKSCGGDFMCKASVFKNIDGFNDSIIAGEEPELCYRIRQTGWEIHRINKEMTLHDANILYIRQWWLRNVRTGHAYAEGAYIHGMENEHFNMIECLKILVWGFLIPISIFLSSIFALSFLSIIIVYPLQILRIAVRYGSSQSANWKYAFFISIGRFPEFQGQFKFIINKLKGLKSSIIEYK